jgi:hypothetical protein
MSNLTNLDYKVHRQSLELKSTIMISKATHSLIGVNRLGTTLHTHSLIARMMSNLNLAIQ